MDREVIASTMSSSDTMRQSSERMEDTSANEDGTVSSRANLHVTVTSSSSSSAATASSATKSSASAVFASGNPIPISTPSTSPLSSVGLTPAHQMDPSPPPSSYACLSPLQPTTMIGTALTGSIARDTHATANTSVDAPDDVSVLTYLPASTAATPESTSTLAAAVATAASSTIPTPIDTRYRERSPRSLQHSPHSPVNRAFRGGLPYGSGSRNVAAILTVATGAASTARVTTPVTTAAAALHAATSHRVSVGQTSTSGTSPTGVTVHGSFDVPLHFSAEYSPSAARRAIREQTHERRDNVMNAASSSAAASTSAGLNTASASAQPVSLVASPVTNQPPTFLSTLFGWSGNTANSSSNRHAAAQCHAHAPPTHPTSHYRQHISTQADPDRNGTNSAPHGLTVAAAASGTSPSEHSHTASGSTLVPAQPTPSQPRSSPPLPRSEASVVSHYSLSLPRTPVVDAHPLAQFPLLPLTSSQQSALHSYSARLRSVLRRTETRIMKLQRQKEKIRQLRMEENELWHAFAISSLVSIASSLYHTKLLTTSIHLQLEFGFSAELSIHLNNVQRVRDGALPLQTLLNDIQLMAERHIKERGEETESSSTNEQSNTRHTTKSSSIHEHCAVNEKQLKELRKIHARRLVEMNSAAITTASSSSSSSSTASPSALPYTRRQLSHLFLSDLELSSIFWPQDRCHLLEQIASLEETSAKLESTYKTMQSKALQSTDNSVRARRFRMRRILLHDGLDSSGLDRRVSRDFFFLHRSHPDVLRAQHAFDCLILDQRSEEGKMIAKWRSGVRMLMDESAGGQLTGSDGRRIPFSPPSTKKKNSQKISPEYILRSIESFLEDLEKRYDLPSMEQERHQHKDGGQQDGAGKRSRSGSSTDGPMDPSSHTHADSENSITSQTSLRDVLSLFFHRSIYPTLGVDVLWSFRSEREQDLDHWYRMKVAAWIGKLTPTQIGIADNAWPIGANMDEPARMDSSFHNHSHSMYNDEQDSDDDDDELELQLQCLDEEQRLDAALYNNDESDASVGADAASSTHDPPSTSSLEDSHSMSSAPSSPSRSTTPRYRRRSSCADSASTIADLARVASTSSSTMPSVPSAVTAPTTSSTSSAAVPRSPSHHHHRSHPHPSSPPPYSTAIQVLHRLNSVICSWPPLDCLHLIIRAVREIEREAATYMRQHRRREMREKKKNERKHQKVMPQENGVGTTDLTNSFGSTPRSPASVRSPWSTASSTPSASGSTSASPYLSADLLFPIVVWVVIRSGLRHPHFMLGTLTRLLPDSIRHFGMGGYALSMVEAAIKHVADMTRSEYMSNSESQSWRMESNNVQVEGNDSVLFQHGMNEPNHFNLSNQFDLLRPDDDADDGDGARHQPSDSSSSAACPTSTVDDQSVLTSTLSSSAHPHDSLSPPTPAPALPSSPPSPSPSPTDSSSPPAPDLPPTPLPSPPPPPPLLPQTQSDLV